nr:unnamed protein product [Digitaria exilis]
MLVQVTRFVCGSLIMGHTMLDFSSRGAKPPATPPSTMYLARPHVPLFPVHPPRVEFEHHGAEFNIPSNKKKENEGAGPRRWHRHEAAPRPQRAGAPGHHGGELLAAPLGRVAELIREQVARVDDAYFKSFIDFTSSVGVAEEEGLVPPLADRTWPVQPINMYAWFVCGL